MKLKVPAIDDSRFIDSNFYKKLLKLFNVEMVAINSLIGSLMEKCESAAKFKFIKEPVLQYNNHQEQTERQLNFLR